MKPLLLRIQRTDGVKTVIELPRPIDDATTQASGISITTPTTNDNYLATVNIDSIIQSLGTQTFTFASPIEFESPDGIQNLPARESATLTTTQTATISIAKNKYEYIQRPYWDVYLGDDSVPESWEMMRDETQSPYVQTEEQRIITTSVNPQGNNTVKIRFKVWQLNFQKNIVFNNEVILVS